MDITLVTSSIDKVVHGTENEKKTGCGINLLKPENVTRFHRTSRMTDLKEITCEKCKANLAKKLIRADKKEMALLLKEEKRREKMGMGDEGIVPLGNTTARITRDPDAKRKEEEARRKAADEARAAAEAKRKAEEEAEREAQQKAAEAENAAPVHTIPGTGIALDDSLAAFAINAPTAEPEAPAAPAADDFLAQFAVQKPDTEAAPVQSNTAAPQDDFLAQFAIPAPQNSPIPGGEPADQYYSEEPEEMDGLDFNYGKQPVQSAPVYGQPQQPAEIQSDDDILQMFSIDGTPVQGVVYEQPLYGGQNVEDTQLGEDVQPYIEPEQQYIQPDYAAAADNATDQLYGYESPVLQDIPETAPVYPQYDQNLSMEMDELNLSPADSIQVPVTEAAPAFDGIPSAENIYAPAIDDISSVQEEAAPAYNEPAMAEDITVPAFDELSAAEYTSAPALGDITAAEGYGAAAPKQLSAYESNIPALDDISADTFNEPAMAEEENDTNMSDYNYVAPGAGAAKNTADAEQPQQPQIIKIPQLAGYDANNQPVYKYMQMKLAGYDQNGQPVYVPVGAQPAAKPAAPAQQQRPQTAAPAQQTAAQAQKAAAAPVQQTVAQAQRAAAAGAPAQQAPIRTTVPRKPVQTSGVPTANISKIAVNPHSKSTSQAFINAIASSKEYADKNLIDTQGLKANSPVLTSVEDVLSTMGDDSAKKQLQAQAQAQQAVPVFEEYKAPQKNTYRGGNSAPRPQQASSGDMRYMTKSELKAKKKQDKIDAKFRKEMSKRGF